MRGKSTHCVPAGRIHFIPRILSSDPKNNTVKAKTRRYFYSPFLLVYQFSARVKSGSPWLWRHLRNLSQARLLLQILYSVFFFPPFSWRPVEERMGNSDVINLGTAGQRSMQTLRVPRLVPMCLCPVDGEIDGVVLPACAAPASQHADWSVWSCGMSPSAPQSHSPLLVWMPITGRKIVI